MSPLRRLGGKIGGAVGLWHPLVPFAALSALLILFAVGGMMVIAREADRSDATRAREAVIRTFGAALARLDLAVALNAASDQIASAVSRPNATPASIYGFLPFVDPRAMGHYGTLVINPDGSAFAGTRFGVPWTGATLTTAARLIAPVAAKLPPTGGNGTHALLRDDTGRVMAIAVVNIARPADSTRPGARSWRLAMFAPVVAQLIPYIMPSLGVEDFRVVAASANANAVTLPVEHGPPLVFAWRPRTPGRAAMARWAPAIGVLLLTAMILLVAAGRSNMLAHRALERLARRDHLTGLANRAAFSEELDRRLARGDPVALGMLDLNGFKDVNDRHGHLVGDALLEVVAAELTRSAGPDDFVARLGGDEFAWLSVSHAGAAQLAAAFTARIAEPLVVGPRRLRVGAAIGIAPVDRGMTASALMAIADARLYDSKNASRQQSHRRVAAGDRLTRRRASRRDRRPVPHDQAG